MLKLDSTLEGEALRGNGFSWSANGNLLALPMPFLSARISNLGRRSVCLSSSTPFVITSTTTNTTTPTTTVSNRYIGVPGSYGGAGSTVVSSLKLVQSGRLILMAAFATPYGRRLTNETWPFGRRT
ncbi:hypothetical protein M0802_012296 [Mischocyttarus mexicanus]|nr:hypothetical protein M0802_012296 [Mischocyttarus mexicanus]